MQNGSNANIFLGLLFLKTVKDDVQTAWKNALVLVRAGHGVSLARVGHAVRKQQTCTMQHTKSQHAVIHSE